MHYKLSGFHSCNTGWLNIMNLQSQLYMEPDHNYNKYIKLLYFEGFNVVPLKPFQKFQILAIT